LFSHFAPAGPYAANSDGTGGTPASGDPCGRWVELVSARHMIQATAGDRPLRAAAGGLSNPGALKAVAAGAVPDRTVNGFTAFGVLSRTTTATDFGALLAFFAHLRFGNFGSTAGADQALAFYQGSGIVDLTTPTGLGPAPFVVTCTAAGDYRLYRGDGTNALVGNNNVAVPVDLYLFDDTVNGPVEGTVRTAGTYSRVLTAPEIALLTTYLNTIAAA
jgi:hypothetical protein